MARILFVVVVLLVGGLTYLTINYSKDSYLLLPVSDKILTNTPATDYQSWIEYASPDGQFKVLFPTPPQIVSDKASDPKTKAIKKYQMYMSEKKDGTIFMINLITFPNAQDATLAQDDVLANVMNDMLVSNPDNHLVVMQEGEYHKHKSLDFVIENATFGYNVRTFATDKTLVVLSCVYKKGALIPKDFEFFLNSFEFTPITQTEKSKK